jgi:hypothetical protein
MTDPFVPEPMTPAEAVAALGGDAVPMRFDRPCSVTFSLPSARPHDPSRTVRFTRGIHLVPASLSTHWWLAAHNAKPIDHEE